ncbi:MAG: hypothetical protein AB2L24_09455 [Mangrovibacterium sp.]
MKIIICILAVFLTVTFPRQELKAQVFHIKSWRGDYPEMNGSYPLSFVAFKGWLIPIPHVFIRTVPTHYYVKAGALPVYDAAGYADLLRINFLKIVSRLVEKSQMEARHEETSGIRDNTQTQKEIEQKIFDAESDHLPDVYSIASGFVRLYLSISRLEKLENCKWLKQLCEKEADELLTRFISVNLFQSGHGKKLEAFSEIRSELNRQIGDVDYTYRKVHHYQFYLNDAGRSYAFLTE